MSDFDTRLTPEKVDVIAPDGSEIRLLVGVDGGSMVHCTLPPGAVSLAVTHKTVGEVWYFLEGQGQVWRKQGDRETVTEVETGLSLSIPLGTHFQFRNTGETPLRFVIVTMPPWPGEDEAQCVTDYWPTN
jgi:mannose-6-phosphate isomerase-like protein (cupin superfamily)